MKSFLTLALLLIVFFYVAGVTDNLIHNLLNVRQAPLKVLYLGFTTSLLHVGFLTCSILAKTFPELFH